MKVNVYNLNSVGKVNLPENAGYRASWKEMIGSFC